MWSPWQLRNAIANHVTGQWTADALCAKSDPEAFFPEKGQSSARARAICLQCRVRNPCLDYALRSPVPLYGVWGGTTVSERSNLTRNRRTQEGPTR